MQDKELYQQILGLSSPWTVVDVHLDHEAQEIRAQVEHARRVKFIAPNLTRSVRATGMLPKT